MPDTTALLKKSPRHSRSFSFIGHSLLTRQAAAHGFRTAADRSHNAAAFIVGHGFSFGLI